jgi:hypothetical protein
VINGGSSTIFRTPSTSRVNRGSARSLVRFRARLAERATLSCSGPAVSAANRSTSRRMKEREKSA